MTTNRSDDSELRPAADNRYMSTRLIVALTLLLGAAFTASALVDPYRTASERSLYSARSSDQAAAVADPSAVQDPEVVASISNWTAETETEKRLTQGSYDWDELWLPR